VEKGTEEKRARSVCAHTCTTEAHSRTHTSSTPRTREHRRTRTRARAHRQRSGTRAAHRPCMCASAHVSVAHAQCRSHHAQSDKVSHAGMVGAPPAGSPYGEAAPRREQRIGHRRRVHRATCWRGPCTPPRLASKPRHGPTQRLLSLGRAWHGRGGVACGVASVWSSRAVPDACDTPAQSNALVGRGPLLPAEARSTGR
jgi:hypothetical protein